MAKTYLHLENGLVLAGEQIGWPGESAGEVVFSTGMTGYPESLTDPSFAGQILTFTYPLMGNYGVPKARLDGEKLMGNLESEKIWVKGVVVSEACHTPSHISVDQSLGAWLRDNKIPGIAGIDTRALTQTLREKGVMQGVISPNRNPKLPLSSSAVNYVALTSCTDKIVYRGKRQRIVLVDCGVKHGIIRALMAEGYEVVRIPWDADPNQISGIDGVVCSNGPGDPKICTSTVENIRKVISHDVPFLGICLGHQLLSLAVGADTYKLKYGHRGLNQPCQDLSTGRAYLTSQNHGFAVSRESIPAGYTEWFINLNDQTSEGIRHKTKKIRSVQFHPEGSPGPFDTKWIFGMFR